MVHVVSTIFFSSSIEEELWPKPHLYHAFQNHSSNTGFTFLAQWFMCISKCDNMIDHSLCPVDSIVVLEKISSMSSDMLITWEITC